MFLSTVKSLSKEQIRQLGELGVPHTRISEWRAEKRLPTRQQVVFLAEVAGVDLDQLQDAVTLLEAKPEQAEVLRNILGKLRAAGLAATVTLSLVISSMTLPADSHAAKLMDLGSKTSGSAR